MKKEVCFALLVFIITAGLFCQEKPIYRNGNDWEKFGKADSMMKIAYLMGLEEGRVAAYNLTSGFLGLLDKEKSIDNVIKFFDFSRKNFYEVDISGAAYGQIADGVDELFKDYANRHIPIFAVATLVAKRITGKIREEDIGPYIQQLRAFKFIF